MMSVHRPIGLYAIAKLQPPVTFNKLWCFHVKSVSTDGLLGRAFLVTFAPLSLSSTACSLRRDALPCNSRGNLADPTFLAKGVTCDEGHPGGLCCLHIT